MRKITLLLIAAFLVGAVALTCQAGPKKKTAKAVTTKNILRKNMGHDIIMPSKEVTAQLGKTASEVIFNPTKVTLYRLEGRDTIKDGEVEVDKNFVRVDTVGTLDKEYVKLVQYLLIADTANYSTDSMRVKSPYYPEIELVFEQKNVSATVLVSLSDFSWTLISDGKKQFTYNYAEKNAIRRLFINIFNFKGIK